MANLGVLLGSAFRHTSLMATTQEVINSTEFREACRFFRSVTDGGREVITTRGEWVNPYADGDTDEFQGWEYLGDMEYACTSRATLEQPEEGIVYGSVWVKAPNGTKYEITTQDGEDWWWNGEGIWWD